MASRPSYLFIDGQTVPYDDARVHILTTAFKYSATIFEGIRAIWSETRRELFVFRLAEHLNRLRASSKVARIGLPMDSAEIQDSLLSLIRKNRLREDLHIRILAYVAEDDGLTGSTEPVQVAIAAMPMGRFPETKEGQSVPRCWHKPLATLVRSLYVATRQKHRELHE